MIINAEVLEGILQHENVHATSSVNKRVTALPIYSERLRLVGTLDVLERTPAGLVIIEHKRGSTKQYNNDQMQIAAQAVAYEEMTGRPVAFGSVFSWQTRRRYQFPVTPALKASVEQTTDQMRAVLAAGKRPMPTETIKKCKACSVQDVCQPALARKLRKER